MWRINLRRAGKVGVVFLYLLFVALAIRLGLASEEAEYWPCLGASLIGIILSGIISACRGERDIDGLPRLFIPLAWAVGILLMTVIWEIVR